MTKPCPEVAVNPTPALSDESRLDIVDLNSLEDATLGACRAGEWVRLRSGWWLVGPGIAGGIGARPSVDGSGGAPGRPDLSKRWPAILDPGEPVLERARPER